MSAASAALAPGGALPEGADRDVLPEAVFRVARGAADLVRDPWLTHCILRRVRAPGRCLILI